MALSLQSQVITHGLGWAVALGSVNLLLQRYTKRNPKSPLAKKTQGGAFEPVPYADYIITFGGQVTIQPLLWSLAFMGRDVSKPWWYGAQPQFASGEFLAYCAGYFLQDWVTHFHTTKPLVAVHHVASIIGSVAAASSSGWLGFAVSTAQAFEFGSIAIELGELGVAPQPPMYILCILSSVVPFVWIVPALLITAPPDLCACFVGVGGVVAGALRAKENWQLYLDSTKPKKKGK